MVTAKRGLEAVETVQLIGGSFMAGSALDLLFDLRAARGDLKAAQLVQSRDHAKSGLVVNVGELKTPDDFVEAQRNILKAAASGEITAQEAAKLGDQLENIGKAVERHDLFNAIEDLRRNMQSTQLAKHNCDLKKEVAALRIEVKKYLFEQDKEWEKRLKESQISGDDFVLGLDITIYLMMLCHMSGVDFVNSGMRNILPRAIQEIYDIFQGVKYQRRGEERENDRDRYRSRNYPERWKPDGWTCDCKNRNTLWIESELNLVDHISIYCEGCFKLVGWGSPDDFERAYDDGHATWLDRSEIEIIEKLKPAPVLKKRSHLKDGEFDYSFLKDD